MCLYTWFFNALSALLSHVNPSPHTTGTPQTRQKQEKTGAQPDSGKSRHHTYTSITMLAPVFVPVSSPINQRKLSIRPFSHFMPRIWPCINIHISKTSPSSYLRSLQASAWPEPQSALLPLLQEQPVMLFQRVQSLLLPPVQRNLMLRSFLQEPLCHVAARTAYLPHKR